MQDAPHAAPEDPQASLLKALQSIAAELAEIKEILVLTTNDGAPLRTQVPSNELMASLAAAMAMLIRDVPLNSKQIADRIAAAQVLAKQLVHHHDAYQSSSQVQSLDKLANR